MARCAALAPREKEVLRRIASHQRPKEIARDLKLSVNTVRGYMSDARKKLGVPTPRDAALRFLEFEALRLPPQIEGDQFQRVAESVPGVAEQSAGYSTPLQASSFADPESAIHHTLQSAGGGGPANSESPLSRNVQNGGNMVFAKMEHGGDHASALSVHDRGFRPWLGRVSSTRWFVLFVGAILAVIAGFGVAMVGLLGVFEVLQQIGTHHR